MTAPPIQSRDGDLPRQTMRRGLPFKGLLRTAALALLLLPATGCLVRTRSVSRTVAPPQVLDATLEQLIQQTDSRFTEIQNIFASMEVSAETGGQHQGEVKEIPTFSGYLFLRKPGDLRLILQLPVVRSKAFDMVSDGKTFSLYLPKSNKAYEGLDEIPTQLSKNGLENVRPYVIRDALVLPAVKEDEVVTKSETSRMLPPAPGTKEEIEEPVYEMTVLHVSGRQGRRIRIVRFGRITLDPYEQDIYDNDGRVVTVVRYQHYQKFGDYRYPALIEIDRPIDEYKLKLEFTKVTINGKLAGDEFVKEIPATVQIQKM